ncbi:protein of unknown function [Salinimicrobium catena]|uniref:DUF937 domain-containing protein n=1 Tax=Salinimicrobium catena TaxID=390640 RepID=A0A1H5LV49_9FLAO|nr:DUF937 domain-containing protein [Salinimicrobium catena]SDL14807.1 protein of unknown function [Salinimicrobium catena]SEE80850.1 protein of unknown function [Salinimicrobium catena]
MASILDFLDTDTGKQFVQRSSKEVDESPDKVRSVLGMALPMLMGAIKKNTTSSEGAEKLNSELDKEKHNGSILDSLKNGDLSGMLSEGSGIIGHNFGGKQDKIVDVVSSATQMDSSKVTKIIKMAAPVIMGILGKQKRKDDVGKGGLSSLVGSVMGTNSSHDQSLLETFMDADDDSNIAGQLTGKLFGGKSDSKGLGGFFKG